MHPRNPILVTGGAGYIGSHANALLNALGFDTIVLDSLVYGHKQALHYAPLPNANTSLLDSLTASNISNMTNNSLGGGHKSLGQSLETAHKNTTFIHADLSDKATLDSIFSTYQIQAVMHFAAFAYVGESVKDPSKYYYNNIANSLNLLESMRKANIKNIIFSSTCATYGHPLHLPITESHPQSPINPYGYSKLVVENMLKDFSHAYGLEYVILRYFNAAGASMLFNIGESHSPETHLIPLLLQTALGQREVLSIYGDDYPTKDGSCVRDYIHIDDLASAHILALTHLLNGGKSEAFNLGNGLGFSIFELLECASRLCGRQIPYIIESRREGDPATLIGDSSKAQQILGWNPLFADIETILSSALNWHRNPRYQGA